MGKMERPLSSQRVLERGYTPRTMEDRDKMIQKLVGDNEALMQEIQSLDVALQRSQAQTQQLQREKEQLEQEGLVGERLFGTVEQIAAEARREREAADAISRREHEELSRRHEQDKEFLQTVFRELEAQLSVARQEHDELRTRAERERRASQRRVRELEEGLREREKEAVALRAQCDAEKEALVKQFEQRVAGLRLEKEQARFDKQVLRRLEADVGELKALALGSRQRDRLEAEYGGPRGASTPPRSPACAAQ